MIERKINDKDLDLISITKGENGELFTTYLGKFITQQEAQKRKSFLDNGFKGKEKDLLKFLEKEPVNIGSERIAFIPSLDKFFGISSFNGEYFTEFFIHKHFADSKEPFTSMSLGQGKLETAKDNLGRYIDKLFKDNGHPFGFLINNKKTMQRLAKDKELYKVKSKGAIETLLTAKMGHIQGAFYKEGLGDIDLVWGDKNYGLEHILEQRAKQWGEEKALKFISHLSENIEKGQIVELEKGRVGIKTDLTTIILDKKENNNFVLTAFRDRNNKKELESLNLSQSKTFTSENAETNAKESPVTPLNQESIIAQKANLEAVNKQKK